MAKAYRAATTQRHGGKTYLAGDIIPAGDIPPYAAQRLLTIGIITESDANVSETDTFSFPYETGNGTESRDVSAKSLRFALRLLQKNAERATEMIESSGDGKALEMLCALESRKSVRAAAEKRIKALGSDGE